MGDSQGVTMMICPQCEREIEIAHEYIGQWLECSLCGKLFSASHKAEKKRRQKIKDRLAAEQEVRLAEQRLEEMAAELQAAKEVPESEEPHSLSVLDVASYCSSCGAAVSENTRFCSSCGGSVVPGGGLFAANMPPPLAPQQINIYQNPGVQTIERTGKKWKAWMLLGAITMVLSVLGAIGAVAIANIAPDQAATALLLSALVFFVGFVMFLIGLIGGWWYHG